MTIRVLFVDDNEGLLRVGSDYLELEAPDFEVTTSPSASLAHDLLSSQSFDVIISDYQMPVMDGLEFLQRVRQSYPNIPFIIFTGRSREEIAIKALNLGATQYVTKGGDPRSQYAELVHIIRNAVDLYREKIAHIESQERYRIVFENAYDGIVMVNSETRKVVSVNNAICSMLDYTEEEMLALAFPDLHPKEDFHTMIESFEKQARGEITIAESIPMLRKDGSVFFADISASPLNIDGVGYQLGVFRDITSRLESEADMREKEAMYRMIAEKSSDVIFILNMDMDRTYLSPSVSNLRGYSYEESLEQSWEEVLTPDSLEKLIQVFGQGVARVREGEKLEQPLKVDLEMIHKDGKSFWVETSATPMYEGGVPIGIIGITRNIDDRKSAERSLRESEERYKALYENLPDGVVTIDPTGVLTLCNDKVLDMFGYTREEVIGRRLDLFLHPHYQRPMMDAFHESMNVGRANPEGFDMIGVRKDGSVFHFHLTSKVIVTNEVITGIQSHLRDISDKKKAEEQLTHQKDELSRFANFMAHDLRSNLHIILGLASCLQEEHKPQYATDIIEAAQKIESILTKSVALADAGSVIGSKDLIDLSVLIKEAAMTSLSGTVNLALGAIPFVRCDRDKMMQVFLNILQNAHEH
ncbi:MAG: PAS domain S-box protein, partial [Candidatus Thorarchaeota archaeon]